MTTGVIAVAGGLGKLDAAAVPASSLVAPGVLGFLVFAALAVALVFLLRSMNKQFRKITPEPSSDHAGQAAPSATEPSEPLT